MRRWSDDHPQAKLMGRKRALILNAARDAFARHGFEGASMESIAAAADVSIMTLYRHAKTKDDLFEAVVTDVCGPVEGTDQAKAIDEFMQRPLVEILRFIGVRFQERLTRPETLGLLRAVMNEHQRFPHLSRMAFEGLIADHVRQMVEFISSRPEAAGMTLRRCEELSAGFFDLFFGVDHTKALLGISVPDDDGRAITARRAAETLVAALNAAVGD